MEYIAFDSHKRYTQCNVQDQAGKDLKDIRINHKKGKVREFLESFNPGTPVAVETIGNWYWIVDEIESAGMVPRLVHARKAKLMMGSYNKTDKLDAQGINQLQRNGTLPAVWIPPAEIRDKRDLTRTRMFLGKTRTRLKNRIHANFAKYALNDFGGISDIFAKRARPMFESKIRELPQETSMTTMCLLEQLDSVQSQIDMLEKRVKQVCKITEEIKLLMTAPGIGEILATVIFLETGSVDRFPSPKKYAGYAGTVPRVHASGGKVRYGALRPDVNRYLKWAFSEAANSICVNRACYPHRHTVKLYERIRARKGHPKAIGAVARHLSEAAYWMMTRKEPYKDPAITGLSSKEA